MSMSKKVLVVDDEPAIVAGIQAVLELNDLEAEGVWDCDTAEQMLAGEFFPVILTDLRMRTEDDGLRIIDAVKRLSPRSVVATFTGYLDAATEQRLRERGAHMILRKPLCDDELMTAVREMLSIVERAGEGHEGDDDALYAGTIQRLHAIARGRFGFSREETDELVQETWLLFLEKRRSVRDARVWLTGTLANLCRQEIGHRVRGRQRWGELGERAYQPPDDTILAVRQALETVDARSRALCTLIGMQAHTYDEVSAAAGIPIGSVGPLYMRAKARMRRALSN
jgi:DNA-directed RNA polymerase specialized sigma24 family protein